MANSHFNSTKVCYLIEGVLLMESVLSILPRRRLPCLLL
jgi:hypothetical protein